MNPLFAVLLPHIANAAIQRLFGDNDSPQAIAAAHPQYITPQMPPPQLTLPPPQYPVNVLPAAFAFCPLCGSKSSHSVQTKNKRAAPAKKKVAAKAKHRGGQK